MRKTLLDEYEGKMSDLLQSLHAGKLFSSINSSLTPKNRGLTRAFGSFVHAIL